MPNVWECRTGRYAELFRVRRNTDAFPTGRSWAVELLVAVVVLAILLWLITPTIRT